MRFVAGMWGVCLIVALGVGCAGSKKKDFWDTSQSGTKTVITPEAGGPTATAAGKADTMKATKAGGPVSFAKDIQPIFKDACFKCHNSSSSAAQLDLTSHSEVMRGSRNGGIVTPGDPRNSKLIQMFEGYGAIGGGGDLTGGTGRTGQAGPGGEPSAATVSYRHERLPKDKVQLIERWIKDGCQNN